MKRKSEIDWPAIERDYRAGTMSNADLAAWYTIGESTIRMRAKRHGWKRGGAVDVRPAHETPTTPETTSPDAIIGRGRNLTLRLMDELEATTARLGELREMIDAAFDGDGKAKEAIEKVLSLKDRADVLKSLAVTAKTFADAGAPSGVKAERQAKAERAASSGRFAPPTAPKMVVDNTR